MDKSQTEVFFFAYWKIKNFTYQFLNFVCRETTAAKILVKKQNPKTGMFKILHFKETKVLFPLRIKTEADTL